MKRRLEFSADSPEAFNLSRLHSSLTMNVYAHKEDDEDVIILGSQRLGEYKQAGSLIPIALGIEERSHENERRIRIVRADVDDAARERGIQARITPTLDTPFRYWTMFTSPQARVDLIQPEPQASWHIANDPESIYGIDSTRIFVNVVAREALSKQTQLRAIRK